MRNPWMNPMTTMTQLRQEIDHLFEDLAPGLRGLIAPVQSFPALNVWEDDDQVYAEAEIPGVTKDALEIFTVGNELTIKGRREPLPEEGRSFHRRERGTGDFTRVVTLPAEVNAEKVEADLHNGVLTVRMPKTEAHKARKITVKTE
jgi:HSP20 family protein